MHKQKLAMMLIILVGGTAVLVSYVHAFLTNPAATEAAWGGVTPDIRPIYGVFMLLAMLGYFAYTYFIFFRLDSDEARIANRFGFTVFNVIYVAILIPSALCTCRSPSGCWSNPALVCGGQSVSTWHWWAWLR